MLFTSTYHDDGITDVQITREQTSCTVFLSSKVHFPNSLYRKPSTPTTNSYVGCGLENGYIERQLYWVCVWFSQASDFSLRNCTTCYKGSISIYVQKTQQGRSGNTHMNQTPCIHRELYKYFSR